MAALAIAAKGFLNFAKNVASLPPSDAAAASQGRSPCRIREHQTRRVLPPSTLLERRSGTATATLITALINLVRPSKLAT
jgi:hypothetical protein